MKINRALIIFYLLASLSVRGQNYLSSQLAGADKLFENGSYFDAVTEYKRLLFFDSTGIYRFEASYNIGLSYKAGARFDDAVKYFAIAGNAARNDTELFNSKIQIVRSNLLRKTYARAHELLDTLERDKRFSGRSDEIAYWRGWAYMLSDDWNAAARTFAVIDFNHELRLLADRTDKSKVSVTFAKVISYILPGAGSIYSGNFLSGLMSLAWNAAAGYWTINAFIANRIFDGLVVGDLVWLRFYRGSLQNGEDFAIQKNLEIANKSLKYLQNEYKGTKP
jgi:hypothetical protein